MIAHQMEWNKMPYKMVECYSESFFRAVIRDGERAPETPQNIIFPYWQLTTHSQNFLYSTNHILMH
jgi:hypothetical protein